MIKKYKKDDKIYIYIIKLFVAVEERHLVSSSLLFVVYDLQGWAGLPKREALDKIGQASNVFNCNSIRTMFVNEHTVLAL